MAPVLDEAGVHGVACSAEMFGNWSQAGVDVAAAYGLRADNIYKEVFSSRRELSSQPAAEHAALHPAAGHGNRSLPLCHLSCSANGRRVMRRSWEAQEESCAQVLASSGCTEFVGEEPPAGGRIPISPWRLELASRRPVRAYVSDSDRAAGETRVCAKASKLHLCLDSASPCCLTENAPWAHSGFPRHV